MVLQLPEQFDLSRSAEYILTVEVRPEQFAFGIYHPDEAASAFYYPVPESKQTNAFTAFSNLFFDNEFFTLPFKNVFVVNYTPVFAFVPALLFDEKDKKEYIHFLFDSPEGKILSQTLQKPELVILHEMPEEVSDFFHRSFVNVRIIHYSALLINHFYDKGLFINGNRMIIYKREKEMDILCFSRDHLLLSNHFDCPQLNDALYYALFVWRQLKFDQLSDFMYVAGEKDRLAEQLKIYVRQVVPVDITLDEAILSYANY